MTDADKFYVENLKKLRDLMKSGQVDIPGMISIFEMAIGLIENTPHEERVRIFTELTESAKKILIA